MWTLESLLIVCGWRNKTTETIEKWIHKPEGKIIPEGTPFGIAGTKVKMIKIAPNIGLGGVPIGTIGVISRQQAGLNKRNFEHKDIDTEREGHYTVQATYSYTNTRGSRWEDSVLWTWDDCVEVID